MMRDDYNQWPGDGSCSGIGDCGCADGGGFNGPIHNILTYLSPWAFKSNNLRKGEGHGASGVVAVYVAGNFTEYKYRRRGEGGIRTVAARYIARFWNNAEGQTWIDEEFAKHVQFDKYMAHLSFTKAPYPGPATYGQLVVGHNTQMSTMTRSEVGFPDESFTSHIHKLWVCEQGKPLDESPPDLRPGNTFRDTSWPAFNHGNGLLGNNIIQLAVSDNPSNQIAAVGFNICNFWSSDGDVVSSVEPTEHSPGNLHNVAWDESGHWLVGGRYSSGELIEPGSRELHRLNAAATAELWSGGGECDSNTTILTPGLYDPAESDERFMGVYWGRSPIYGGLSWEWNGEVPGANPAARIGVMRVDRAGVASPSWATAITAAGNGPVLYDIDQKQRVYFGGYVTLIGTLPVDPNQLYRVDWDGGNPVQIGSFSGSVTNARLFTSDWGDPAWDGAGQIIVASDGIYTPPAGALYTHKAASPGSNEFKTPPAGTMFVVSTDQQEIEPQKYWPAPWKKGGQYELGDFMPGLVW
jgi:hypothetical protein